jgi:hypothetical protein
MIVLIAPAEKRERLRGSSNIVPIASLSMKRKKQRAGVSR